MSRQRPWTPLGASCRLRRWPCVLSFAALNSPATGSRHTAVEPLGLDAGPFQFRAHARATRCRRSRFGYGHGSGGRVGRASRHHTSRCCRNHRGDMYSVSCKSSCATIGGGGGCAASQRDQCVLAAGRAHHCPFHERSDGRARGRHPGRPSDNSGARVAHGGSCLTAASTPPGPVALAARMKQSTCPVACPPHSRTAWRLPGVPGHLAKPSCMDLVRRSDAGSIPWLWLAAHRRPGMCWRAGDI